MYCESWKLALKFKFCPIQLGRLWDWELMQKDHKEREGWEELDNSISSETEIFCSKAGSLSGCKRNEGFLIKALSSKMSVNPSSARGCMYIPGQVTSPFCDSCLQLQKVNHCFSFLKHFWEWELFWSWTFSNCLFVGDLTQQCFIYLRLPDVAVE